jgi:hypothetical protein
MVYDVIMSVSFSNVKKAGIILLFHSLAKKIILFHHLKKMVYISR